MRTRSDAEVKRGRRRRGPIAGLPVVTAILNIKSAFGFVLRGGSFHYLWHLMLNSPDLSTMSLASGESRLPTVSETLFACRRAAATGPL